MTKLKNKLNMQRHWLNWCRLCANDDANNNVRHKAAYMRIISKCFDVEIGLEEPALGAVLCNDCYTLIGDLILFIENVNKVQTIFELLRHTEDGEQIDVLSLRQQYGLQTTFKVELTDGQLIGDDNGSDSAVKIKRRRPRFNRTEDNSGTSKTCKEELSINVEELPLDGYEEGVEEELEENHIWLEDVDRLETQQHVSPIKTKREASKIDLDIMSQDSTTYSAYDQGKELVDEAEPTPIKRKRGRPRKNQLDIVAEANSVKCKNLALARLLLASPEPGTGDEQPNSSNKRSVECNICHRELSSESGLRQHTERVHMKMKPVVCDCCGKRVNNSSELKEHMLVHTDERPFSCPVCSASFKNKKRLNIHSQTHGVPKYECEICGKKLQTRAIWNKHKYVHTNERRFKCTICGTATKHSTALKVHLLSHTGFRPYACKYCNKAFASGANCRDHKLKKHPEEFAKDTDKSSRIQSVPTLDELRALAEGMEKGARLRKPRYSINK